MWHLYLATAAVSKLSDTSEVGDFLATALPAVAAILNGLGLWMTFNRRAIRARRVSLRAFMVLIGMLSPGFALLKWVYWPW